MCHVSISHALKSRTMQHSPHADPPNAKCCRNIWYNAISQVAVITEITAIVYN